MYVWQPGGFGATARGDAGPPMMSLFSAGTKNQPIEVLERAYPILFERVGMVPDSMGAGRNRGGRPRSGSSTSRGPRGPYSARSATATCTRSVESLAAGLEAPRTSAFSICLAAARSGSTSRMYRCVRFNGCES